MYLALALKEGEILKQFIKVSEKLLTQGETQVESNEWRRLKVTSLYECDLTKHISLLWDEPTK